MGRIKSTWTEKVDWLRRHPELWQHIHRLHVVTFPEPDFMRLAQAMKVDGLYSHEVHIKQIRLAQLLEDARQCDTGWCRLDRGHDNGHSE